MSRSIRRRIEKELQKYQLFKYCTYFTQNLCKLSVGKACISNRYRTRVYSSKSKNCTTSPPPRHSIAGQYNRSLPSNWPNKSFRRESNKKGFWNQRRWEDKMKLKMRDIKDREEGKVSEGVAVVWGQLSLLSSFLGHQENHHSHHQASRLLLPPPWGKNHQRFFFFIVFSFEFTSVHPIDKKWQIVANLMLEKGRNMFKYILFIF